MPPALYSEISDTTENVLSAYFPDGEKQQEIIRAISCKACKWGFCTLTPGQKLLSFTLGSKASREDFCFSPSLACPGIN